MISVQSTDIAIVGISAEVPEARSTEAFWDIIKTGKSLTRPFPAERRAAMEEYIRYLKATSISPDPESGVKFHDGSYLSTFDRFDYSFFGMTPKQASVTDPHQRLILRNMYLAFENAGYSAQSLRGSRTGVYVGYSGDPAASYLQYVCRIDGGLMQLGLTGNIPTMMANRFSYIFNLRGPSMVLDSACSASLVAAHQARIALSVGECDLAVVAGSRIVFAPVKHPHSKLGIESSDGFTRTFDEAADGTGFGEGAGAVVLKRLADAVADGNQIYAVIKGSAVNHDGNAGGITGPDPQSQAELLQEAWKRSGVAPQSIGYIEVHGTATRVGDPVEYEGLQRAFAGHTDREQFCAVGTVKANIGHLFEASGVMGLIKTALILRHRVIPPLANFKTPNPAIDFSTGPVYAPTDARPWESSAGPRRCGLSAFGLGGTNAHMVLEEYHPESAPRTQGGGPYLFALSADTPTALRQLAERYVGFIDLGRLDGVPMEDICYTTAVSRSGHPARLAASVNDLADLRRQLMDGVPVPISDEHLAEQAATYLQTGSVDARAASSGRGSRIVDLPGYTFEEARCAYDFPATWRDELQFTPPPSTEQPLTYAIEFQSTAASPEPTERAKLLALVDGAAAERRLSAALGADVDFVRYSRPDAGTFPWMHDPEAFADVAAKVNDNGYTHVVHALAFETNPAGDITEIDSRVQKNLYSLFLLSKALMHAGVKVTLAVVTLRAIAAHDTGMPAAENATLAGLSRVIGREYPYIKSKVVDIDERVPADHLRNELLSREPGLFLLRSDQRLREVFTELADLEPDQRRDYLKPRGTYLVTGGTGALGLAVAEFFVEKQPDINIVLLSRSGAPDSGEWNQITGGGHTDEKKLRLVQTLQRLSDAGADVTVLQGDVGDPDATTAAIDKVRQMHGRIDGIVHAAGIPGESSIIFRRLEDFVDVVRPKVHGAYQLDWLTKRDKPDFVVHFSSVAAVFPAPGQGDYAAASYYLDNIASAQNDDNCRVLSLDWVAWKQIGMAVEYGTNGDTIFKSLDTVSALQALDAGIRSRHSRIFVGEINYEGDLVNLLQSYAIKLSPGIAAKVENAVGMSEERLRRAAEKIKRNIEETPVSITGRPDNDYSMIETTVARCMAHAFGCESLGVDDDFFAMGGDSVMAVSVAVNIATCLGVPFDVADLLSNRTVSEIAYHIETSADFVGAPIV